MPSLLNILPIFFTNFVNVRPTNPPFNVGTFLQSSFIREFIQDYYL